MGHGLELVQKYLDCRPGSPSIGLLEDGLQQVGHLLVGLAIGEDPLPDLDGLEDPHIPNLPQNKLPICKVPLLLIRLDTSHIMIGSTL